MEKIVILYQNIKLLIKSFIGKYSHIYFLILKVKKGKVELFPNYNTDIVISGPPRSANSFAFQAFLKAQKKDINISHHLHVSCVIKEAVKRKIPVILLIRRPVDVVCSWVIRNPNLSPYICMLYYISYYNSLKKYINEVVIAPFYIVIKDYGKVIEVVNEKFDKNFNIFNHSKKNEKIIFFERIKYNKSLGRNKFSAPVPFLAGKKKLKNIIGKKISNLKITKKAENLYEFFVKKSDFASSKK